MQGIEQNMCARFNGEITCYCDIAHHQHRPAPRLRRINRSCRNNLRHTGDRICEILQWPRSPPTKKCGIPLRDQNRLLRSVPDIVNSRDVPLALAEFRGHRDAPVIAVGENGTTAVIAQFVVGVLIDVVSGDCQNWRLIALDLDTNAAVAPDRITRDPGGAFSRVPAVPVVTIEVQVQPVAKVAVDGVTDHTDQSLPRDRQPATAVALHQVVPNLHRHQITPTTICVQPPTIVPQECASRRLQLTRDIHTVIRIVGDYAPGQT